MLIAPLCYLFSTDNTVFKLKISHKVDKDSANVLATVLTPLCQWCRRRADGVGAVGAILFLSRSNYKFESCRTCT